MRVVTSTMRVEVRRDGERALIEHGGRTPGERERPKG